MQANYMDAVKIAQQAMNASKHEAAVVDFERAIKIDATQPLAHVGLAETRLQQGDIEAAVQSARMAVQYRPNFGRAQWALALCLSRLAETRESLDAKNDC